MIVDKPSRRAFPIQGAGRSKPETPVPDVVLLSNGRYSVMTTASGAGSSSWRGLDVTRWREDATRDCWGQFVYVRDLMDERFGRSGISPCAEPLMITWSPSTPTGPSSAAETQISRPVWPSALPRTRTRKCAWSPLVNHGARPREFDLTSYTEVCLNNRRTDQAGPAFAKLFLETEFLPGPSALIARRRPRGATKSRSGRSTSRRWTTRRTERWSTRPTGLASWAAAGRRPTRRP